MMILLFKIDQIYVNALFKETKYKYIYKSLN